MEHDLKVERVTDVESDAFAGAMDIYSKSFPANETRPVEKTKEMIAAGDSYGLFVAEERRKVVGMSLVYVFGKFALLDYMAVAPDMKRRGIGSALFRCTVESLRDGDRTKTLLLEVQKEADGEYERTERIEFYRGLGVKIILDNYLLPSYIPGCEAEETYMMVYPISGDFEKFDRDDVKEFVSMIHLHVYGYESDDLLERVLDGLSKSSVLHNSS